MTAQAPRDRARRPTGARCARCSNARVQLRGEARAWVWGLGRPRMRRARAVTAWGSASVFATGSASVEALETAIVVAGGSVGGAGVRCGDGAGAGPGAGGGRRAASASCATAPGVTVSGGGRTDAARLPPPEEWCAYYGVDGGGRRRDALQGGRGRLHSYHGGSYRPGTEPRAPDWDGGERECGGGLHFSPGRRSRSRVPDDAHALRRLPRAARGHRRAPGRRLSRQGEGARRCARRSTRCTRTARRSRRLRVGPTRTSSTSALKLSAGPLSGSTTSYSTGRNRTSTRVTLAERARHAVAQLARQLEGVRVGRVVGIEVHEHLAAVVPHELDGAA